MKITTKKERRAVLADGTEIAIELDDGDEIVRVRAGRPGNGPDAGATAAIDLDVPGEWLERITVAMWQMATGYRHAPDVCPDHGRFQSKAPHYDCGKCRDVPGECGENDGDSDCAKPKGHSGPHIDGFHEWTTPKEDADVAF